MMFRKRDFAPTSYHINYENDEFLLVCYPEEFKDDKIPPQFKKENEETYCVTLKRGNQEELEPLLSKLRHGDKIREAFTAYCENAQQVPRPY